MVFSFSSLRFPKSIVKSRQGSTDSGKDSCQGEDLRRSLFHTTGSTNKQMDTVFEGGTLCGMSIRES